MATNGVRSYFASHYTNAKKQVKMLKNKNKKNI